MALSSVAVTYNLADMLGTDFDYRRTKVWVTTNVPDDTVIDTVGNAIRLGSGRATLGFDGTGSLSVWVPGTGSNPDTWQTSIHVDYPDPGSRSRVTRSFGPFTITTAADLADLVEEQEVPAEYLTTVTNLLDGYVDDAEDAADRAEAAAADAVDISGISTSDGVVSALIDTVAGPLTQAALSASIDEVGKTIFTPQVGKRLVAWGDSLTATGRDSTPLETITRDVWNWLVMLSGGRFQYVHNAGVSGNLTSQMLARFSTDVAPYNPDIVTIWGGTNESAQIPPTSLATYAANIRSMVAAVRGIGAKPVILGPPPNATAGNQRKALEDYNAWLRYYCRAENITHVDVYGLLTDPATADYLSGYGYDGVHHSSSAAKAIGQYMANVLSPLTEAWSPFLPTNQTADSRNMLSGALFLTDTAGVGTGWLKINANGAASIVKGDAAIAGNWQRITDTNTSLSGISKVVTTGFSVGDTIAFVGRIGVRNGTSTAQWYLSAAAYGPPVTQLYALKSSNPAADGGPVVEVDNGIFYYELVVPAATTSITIDLVRTASVAGNGYSQMAQVGLYNLTTMGVLSA